MNENFYSQFAERLKNERDRLGLSQAEAGDLCGVSREMWGKYERGKGVPGGEVLFSFAAAGADINYILTGQRTNRMAETSPGYTALSREEAALLDNFRHTDKGDQAAIKRMALLAAQAAKAEKEQKAWNGIELRKSKG